MDRIRSVDDKLREDLEEALYEKETYKEEVRQLKEDLNQRVKEVADYKNHLIEMRMTQGATMI